MKPNLPGDILAFVPGIKDFQTLSKLVEKTLQRHQIEEPLEIKFIHSRFSEELKQSVMQATQQRQLIISTTICETSLTLPNLSYVVDSCLARNKIGADLVTTPCSYEAVLQRLGRVGRCAPGVYIPCIQAELLEKLP